MIGQVAIAGLTIPEIESILESEYLNKGILLDPQVSVSVQEYLSQFVLVLGNVPSPGRYPITSSIKLLDMLAEAKKNAYQQRDMYDVVKATLIRNADTIQPGLRLAIDI